MIRYTAQRILFIIPVALLVSFMTFMIIHIIPGDPARILLGEFATPQELAALRQQLGLDKPLLQQFVLWLWQLFHGNLGQSLQLQQPVLDAIAQRFPVTAELGICSLLFSLAIAFPLGVYSATHRNTRLDWIMNVLILFSTAIPSFVLGLVLIFVFAVTIRLFPAGGYVPFNQDPLNNIRDLILPMVALGTGAVAGNMRQIRASMIEVLGQDYIRMARAKGIGERRINYSHALRNAVIPVLTIIGIQVGSIIAGTFVIETIYLWPGVGQLAITSIFSKDYPVIQGIVLLSAFFYMGANLLVDLSYVVLDPRIRLGQE
ncbi:MAG TPA: ABC transporter permease [Ktedonobacteraceae bacterium]|nr:ABC transporter permease [Ktedonobacteraceae bacterium]